MNPKFEGKHPHEIYQSWQDAVAEYLLKKQPQEERTRLKEKAVPAGSTRTRVCANISGLEDLAALQASRAEGVGLFRSEFLFLDRAQAPSEEEQYSAYACVAKAMGEKETVIRTMDLGSDKKPDWLPLPDEKNPALGWRGLRVSLKERELFKTQIRALLRAADAGNLKVMVPMVTSVREAEAVRDCMRECAGELSKEGVRHRIPPLGVMIETPAAALIAGELAKEVDFFSIGTNDLTQYTLALDREACGLEDYYDPCHEAVLKLIQMTAAAGHDHQIPTSVCGELAGDPRAIPKLVEAGVDKLSVSLPKIEATLVHVLAAEKKLPQEPDQAPEEGMIAAPADGKLIPMEDIPDPVFSSGAMGECAGILPENGMIYAPCDGTVTGIAKTKHAITFTSVDGKQILVHVGIDTVRLNGKGFTVFVEEGSAISKGDKVMEANLNVIRSAGLSTIVVTACIH